MTENKAAKRRNSLLLQFRVNDLGSLHKRSHNSSPASSITPLFPMTLLDAVAVRMTLLEAELHQRFGCGRLLRRGSSVELPHELRCLPIHGLHLKGVALSSSDGACGGEGGTVRGGSEKGGCFSRFCKAGGVSAAGLRLCMSLWGPGGGWGGSAHDNELLILRYTKPPV